jgi:signal transduction histidine kinase
MTPFSVHTSSRRVHLGRCAFASTYITTREQLMRRDMSLKKTYPAAFVSGLSGNMTQVDLFTFFNSATVLVILSCVGIILWLVYREHRRSRDHIRTIDTSLAEDRYVLEHKISHRTLELVDTQRLHRQELERIAEFGTLSKGLFHDLIGPLSAVSLSIERLASSGDSSHEASQALHTALEASRRMASFMESIRAVMQHPLPNLGDVHAESSRELTIVLDLLAYKARVAGVHIDIRHHDNITLPLHPVRFQQLFLNIISNALEAHADTPAYTSIDKNIIIDITKTSNIIRISITDNGPGISLDHVGILLKHPFTTKKSGSGTGLMTVKSIVEEELHGTLHITNVPNIGTVCEIVIPLST